MIDSNQPGGRSPGKLFGITCFGDKYSGEGINIQKL